MKLANKIRHYKNPYASIQKQRAVQGAVEYECISGWIGLFSSMVTFYVNHDNGCHRCHHWGGLGWLFNPQAQRRFFSKRSRIDYLYFITCHDCDDFFWCIKNNVGDRQ